MKWQTYKKPERKGEYLLALRNTIRSQNFYAHIEIDDKGTWVQPGSGGDLVCYGPHIEVRAFARITSPFKP